jgi:hypothetical protein
VVPARTSFSVHSEEIGAVVEETEEEGRGVP